MALETVDLHGGIAVTGHAEIRLGLGDAVGLGAGVAVDATAQAGSGPAYAGTDGVITLVLEQVHVLASHGGRVGQTPGSGTSRHHGGLTIRRSGYAGTNQRHQNHGHG